MTTNEPRRHHPACDCEDCELSRDRHWQDHHDHQVNDEENDDG